MVPKIHGQGLSQGPYFCTWRLYTFRPEPYTFSKDRIRSVRTLYLSRRYSFMDCLLYFSGPNTSPPNPCSIDAIQTFRLTGISQCSETLSKSEKNSQLSQKNSQLPQKNSQLSQKNSQLSQNNSQLSQKNSQFSPKNLFFKITATFCLLSMCITLNTYVIFSFLLAVQL